jgi:GT2 family glycosyltransferase
MTDEAQPIVPGPELSVLIVNYNSWKVCAKAIASLRACPPTRPDGSPMPFECVVVDNQSPQRPRDDVAAVEHQLAELRRDQRDPAAGKLIWHGENGGYSKGMNLALQHGRGRWILVSNPDVVFTSGLIDALLRHLESDPGAGCAVPKGYLDPSFGCHLPPNTLPTLLDVVMTMLGEFSRRLSVWYARHLTRSWVRIWSAERPLPLPMMSGCLFLVERAFFERIGRFDERFPLYYEDTDLSLRIRKAGRHIVQVPGARLIHLVNRSGMSDVAITEKRHDVSRGLYYRKWYGAPGTWMLKLSRWVLSRRRLQSWRKSPPFGRVVDLGEGVERPAIQLPHRCERFLLLASLDARGYLAAGTFGSGDRWTPTDEVWENLPSASYYFEVYDLTGGGFVSLGKWRYRSLTHLGVPMPHLAKSPPAAAAVAGGAG